MSFRPIVSATRGAPRPSTLSLFSLQARLVTVRLPRRHGLHHRMVVVAVVVAAVVVAAVVVVVVVVVLDTSW